jgi:hypothetical protein
MKFFTVFLVITVFIIDSVQNVPVIHPIHIHTVPLRPITARSTPQKPSVTFVPTIRPSLPSTTTYNNNNDNHSSSTWYHQYSTGKCVVGIFLLVIVSVGLVAAFRSLWRSKKQQKSCKKVNSVVVENKMYVSTINGTREEPPPRYSEIHHV